MENQAEYEKMVAARMRLVRDHVFFGAIAMGMKLVEKTDLDFLAATDGKSIFYNPNRTKDLTPPQREGLIGHEAGHPILLHVYRKGRREHKKWNRACDYALNPLLLESGLDLPPNGCVDRAYYGMSAEQVYNLLLDEDGKESGDNIMDPSPEDSIDSTAAEADMKAQVQNAAALARKAGQMTGGIAKLVEATCKPKADWKSILWDFVTSKAEVDFNWALPHQRMLQQYGVMYPTMDGNKIGHICLVNDASGSCSKDQEQFASELSDILEAYEVCITVLHHDTELKSVEEYTSADLPIILHPSGFGGTKPDGVYAHLRENYTPDVIIHTTDLMMDFDNVPEPDCPVLIAATSKEWLDCAPPWATVVDIS